MHEEFVVECPYCGEHVDVYVEADVRGSFIQDCEVCCNPWRVDVRDDNGERYIAVRRADGSE
jgi:Cysteine-rich CPXCG